MDLKYFGTVAAAVFVLQFAFCLKKTKLTLRLLPTVLLAAGMAACAILYAVRQHYPAATLGIILALLLALDGLAWLAAFLVEHRK